jgi:phenylpropionate dioxygenase-like ring-hydroxylating dioxygenase large terminal subunit
MNRTEELMSLTRRAVANIAARTTDQAEDTMALPVSAYLDPERYRNEVDRIFRRLPLGLALSSELRGPGAYRAMTVMGTPVLLARGRDGVARGFLNVCRHRGAVVCPNGAGHAEHFVCPYHAWSYDDRGVLDGVYGGSTFGDIDRAALSLTPLPTAERAGFIWTSLDKNATFDIDSWLGAFGTQVAALGLENWHIYERRELDGPGWKVAWDGYLEGYHQAALHPNTVGKNTIANMMVVDAYGPHQRIVFGRKSLRTLLDQPEENWNPGEHIRLIHSGFPNLSISGVLGDHCLVSQIFPGPTPDRSLTVQTILCQEPPETEAAKAAAAGFSAMVLQAVRDEDYAVGFTIQEGLASGANDAFVFGRNEPTLQHYHRWVAKLGGEA